MRGADRLQKILYLLMIVLGIYILYKAGDILLRSPATQQALDSGNIQRELEDSAMRTWAPGYATSVENRETGGWAAGWMSQAVPVYSYLAGGQAVEDETEQWTKEGTEKEKREPEETQEESTEQEQTVQAETKSEQEAKEVSGTMVSDSLLKQLEDFDYLLANYYTVDAGTTADAELLDADALLEEDLTIQKDPDVPQILIYHTHSQEAFADSGEGKVEDTIVGMGEVLAEELRNTYGYNVIHDTGVYDLVDGVLDRSAAYDYARASIEGILQENPSIEVVIDLHRDGVEGQKFVTEIDGKPASMIMFFNGISRDNLDQPLYWLENPYVKQNLAFSLQMQLAARERYPGYTRNIYLKAERFNLHLRPRSLLIEAGTQLNTVEEEQNAMIPLAELLSRVLEGR